MYHVWGEKKSIQYFEGKSERKRTLGKPSHRCTGNITVDLKYNGRAHPGMIS